MFNSKKEINNLKKKIEELEISLWEHSHPAKFNLDDKVKVTGSCAGLEDGAIGYIEAVYVDKCYHGTHIVRYYNVIIEKWDEIFSIPECDIVKKVK